MPRPHHSRSEIELLQKINTLSTKLLQANAALRLKTIYCERLELLLHNRNQRVDQLFGLLEHARQQNEKLDAENEHLAALVANDNRAQAQIS